MFQHTFHFKHEFLAGIIENDKFLPIINRMIFFSIGIDAQWPEPDAGQNPKIPYFLHLFEV
jgi:hypothetical protein